MDQKIKELLIRLSFFAEDGMADKPIVEIAKQADALLLEVARKPNTQQPVAWRVTHIDDQDEQYIAAWDKRRVAHFQASPAAWEMTPLYIAPPSPPLPSNVLMAFGEAVRDAVEKACCAIIRKHQDVDASFDIAHIIDTTGSGINLTIIADRYASQVQTEPVNQQMLAALKELASIVKIHSMATENNFAWAELEDAEIAIAAADAAQPVGQQSGGSK